MKALDISDHLTCLADFVDASGSKYASVINLAQLYMQGLHGILNLSEYGSIMPQ